MLNDSQLRKLKFSPKPYRMADGRGLYLWVTPAGGRSWRYKYRFEGREKLMSFGQYPDVPLVSARELLAAARRVLATGVDPMAARKAEKVASSLADASNFRSVALLWLDHWRTDKSAQHVGTTERRLEHNIFPHLGEMPVRDVTARDLVRMAKAIEARGVGDLAKRSLQTVGQVMRYAIAHGYADRNPAADIRPGDVLKPVRSVNLARVDAAALPGLLRAIEIYRGKVVTRLAMRMMALTFVRTGELIGARWAEFDIAARRWNIPAERMKMKTPHIVPLATQSLEVLGLLREVTGGGELLFPGERTGTMSKNTILEALDRMGYGGVMTGHGFRGLASTLLHEQGYPHDHIELQLAHAPRNAVSAAYNHALYLAPRAEMMQGWADYLERAKRLPV